MLKTRFGLKSAHHSGNMARKPGMSIINPLSKRRKTPKGGVQFDDDDNDDGENQDQDDESDNSSSQGALKK